MPYISVVTPVYKAEEIVDELISRLVESLSKITDDFEIILVEDGSLDNSWEKIKENCQKDKRIKGIKLSRNFGQHYAITAGIDFSEGDWVVVMDCDLQDKPEEIYKLYKNAIENNYDAALAKRVYRKDHFIKKIVSKLFYKVLSYLTGVKYDHSIANFGIYSKNIINEIKKMRESIRYFPTMVNWIGFKTGSVIVEHGKRFRGKTSYSFRKMVNLSIDIVLAYSDKPLKLAVKLGLIISLISICFALYNLLRALVGDIEVLGYASLIISIWLLSGIIIFVLGIIGLYVGKTFECVRNRQIYIIEEKTWLK